MSPKLKRSLICWGLLSPIVVVILFPYLTMLSTALTAKSEIFVFEKSWFPKVPTLENFAMVWTERGFGRALANSLYISIGATLLSVIVAVPAAYAMSRLHFKGRNAYRIYLLITQMISPIVLIIGLFRLFAFLGMVNSMNALIAAQSAFFMAFAIWMTASYFDTVPKELEEAAWLDGAGKFTAFMRVFLPLCLPGIAVTALFTFINSWNEYALALTLLRDNASHTVPVAIAFLTGTLYEIEWNLIMAATFMATIPVAIIFASIQRYLIRGLSLGGVK
ncbi:MAG: ABC transporter permease subunit [Rhizobiaceae bacterium]|nr:ABC transporter permease subunit [Rhizobiaceae bacterium]